MAQLLQINPPAKPNMANEYVASMSAATNRKLPVSADALVVKKLEAELNEHRYYLERKVEQRTEQLMKRISLLESCNATLCGKLAQANSDIAALNKLLAVAVPEAEPTGCHGQLPA